MRIECPDYDVDPAIDKGILYQEGVCPSTDPRLLWDYTNGILNVDGKIAASGSIATSNDLEGSMLASLALGTGSFNFTPPAGYGGLVYRGGSIWYYWDNTQNMWETLDFASHVQNTVSVLAGAGLVGGGPLVSNVTLSVDPNYGFVDIYHNNAFVGNRPIMNFQDTVSVSWGISSNGNVAITAFGTGGGAWLADVNANNFSINNLNSINGIPVSLLCTNPFNRNVTGNNYNLTQVGNIGCATLNVATQITYQGVPIEDFFASGGLWTANPDGSIYRNSNVFINGTNTPLTVTSSTASSYIYLDASAGTGQWCAFAAQFAGVYSGELGFGTGQLELWTKNSLIIRGFDGSGIAYLPGPVGIGTQTPQFPLDIVGGPNATTCYYIHGLSFACWDGSGGINLGGTRITASISINSPIYQVGGITFAQGDGGSGVNLTSITNINGTPAGSMGQTPWRQAIDGGGFSLGNVGSITANGSISAVAANIGINGLAVAGNINTNGCYYISNIPFACNNGTGQFNLSNVALINGSPPGSGGSGYNGPTTGGRVTGRNLGITYQNTTGRPMWVSVTVLFNQPYEVTAWTGYTLPMTVDVARLNVGASTEGTWPITFIVLPNQYYQVEQTIGTGGVGAEEWSEWY